MRLRSSLLPYLILALTLAILAILELMNVAAGNPNPSLDAPKHVPFALQSTPVPASRPVKTCCNGPDIIPCSLREDQPVEHYSYSQTIAASSVAGESSGLPVQGRGIVCSKAITQPAGSQKMAWQAAFAASG